MEYMVVVGCTTYYIHITYIFGRRSRKVVECFICKYIAVYCIYIISFEKNSTHMHRRESVEKTCET